MLSFVIGLNINDNHVTATLVRLEESDKQKLTIERDTFYLRLFPSNMKKDPSVIISVCIDCIDDLLCDFINYYRVEDTIIGITCGITNSMSCDREMNEKNPFFGLNLSLLFQSALRDLIRRRKHHHYPRYCTPPTSPRATLSDVKSQINTIGPTMISSTSHSVFNFSPTSTIDEIIHNSKLPKSNLKNYCGVQDNQTKPSPTTELVTPKSFVSTDDFSSKQRSMMNQLVNIPITFSNQTICLGLGEAINLYHQNYERILVLTLSANFDFVFMDRGKIIPKPSDILFETNSSSDESFSTRGLMNIYKKLLQNETKLSNGYSLVQLALNNDTNAIKAYEIFARRLGKFLVPFLQSFQPDLLLIGGEIAQAWYLIEGKLRRRLRKFSSMEIYFSLFNEKSICLGAVLNQLSNLRSRKNRILRHTDQCLLPVTKIKQWKEYPSHEIPIGYIGVGHQQLNGKLFRFIEENPILLIDGFLGTDFEEFAEKFNEYYFQHRRKKKFLPLFFYDTKIFLQMDTSIEKQPNSLSSNDRSFSKELDLKKFNYLRNNLSYPCVISGFGASFINETSPLVYIDLPRNELYYRTGKSTIDCSIFSRLKRELLPRMNIFVDGQRPNCPTWLDGDTFRQALAHMSNQPIRTRPCMKTIQANPSKTLTNHRRSSDIMTSDNGILLSDIDNHLLEFSWDILYHSQVNRLLDNDAHYRLFHQLNDLPICFNLLDRIDEECTSEMSMNFQEHQKRNKAYYIIKEPNLFPKNHDFLLVPNGSLHITSHNQVILEIFTTFNSEQGMKTASFAPHTGQLRCRPVSIGFVPNQCKEQQLPTPDFYIYDIHRLVIIGDPSIDICRKRDNRFHLCILVQGDAIEITFNSIDNKQEKQTRQYHYLETFLIPASIDEYSLRPIIVNPVPNVRPQSYILLIAFLKGD